ncbi:MAG: hypothetical protein FWF78_01905 [Defluviitaleaceae bacterium]|nr:hypothetical protein [Defluviitaleaceae bacterium]
MNIVIVELLIKLQELNFSQKIMTASRFYVRVLLRKQNADRNLLRNKPLAYF